MIIDKLIDKSIFYCVYIQMSLLKSQYSIEEYIEKERERDINYKKNHTKIKGNWERKYA